MPNWCSNTVYLKHKDPAMLQKAADGFNGEGLFAAFLPTPPKLLEDESWYNWNLENWGTKWDVSAGEYDEQAVVEFNQLNIAFHSAWSPPIAFYDHLVELGFDVNAYYYEPGMDFCGHWVNGEDEAYERTTDIPEDIDREFSISENNEMWEEDQ